MPKKKSPPASKNRQSLVVASRSPEQARALLRPRSDFSLHTFRDTVFEACMARQSLFTGALFQHCAFRRSDLSRCDFEGARLEHCTFEDVDLSSIDLRSTVIANCRFSETRLDGAYISDCTFHTTEFATCSLSKTTIVDNRFKSCRLFRCSLEASTILLNTFAKTSFEDQSLGSCTILYSIFEACAFKSVQINADAIGWSFGITRDQLSDIEFIFLGKPLERPEVSDIIGGLVEAYEKRGWKTQAAIGRLNFRLEHPLTGFATIFRSLLEVPEGMPIKKDDVTFILRMMQCIKDQGRLPFFAVISAFENAQRAANVANKEIAAPALSYLSQELLVLVDSMRGELFTKAEPLVALPASESIVAELVYDEAPSASGLLALSSASRLVGRAKQPARLDGTRTGSYIEIISTVVSSLFALWVALYLLEGCIVRLTFVRARINKLVAKQPPLTYQRRALDPQQHLPEEFERPLRRILDSLSSTDINAILQARGLSNTTLKEIRLTKPKRHRRRASQATSRRKDASN